VYETSSNGSTLRIPLQSVPINRSPMGGAAFGDSTGVEASWSLGGFLKEHIVPRLPGLATGLLSAI
jgi:hypothetical protein